MPNSIKVTKLRLRGERNVACVVSRNDCRDLDRL